MDLLPFVDVLKVFNNPINEEQAWAVCYQCANFLHQNPTQEFFQVVYDYGIHSIWLGKHGDVLLRKRPPEPNGSGKGPPHSSHHHPSNSPHIVLAKRKRHLMATEIDAVQALGAAIFEALDFGIDPSEERQLSHGLESLIVTMTNADISLEYDPNAPNVDDEGIEKDADIEHRCTVLDVLRLCRQHLSSKQDALHHYKAVCRALATEAGELFTFLERIASSKEKLAVVKDEDAKRLEELQRADWACLWVQVMRSLRQGVRLKKVEHINLPPVEYELTPFEMLLEDIRSRRYTLHKITVNGEIPHKVKTDAHAVILDFIRSRPPLKRVDDRKLKPKPPSPPDPHELLLKEIRSCPKLRPVRHGKLVVETPRPRLSSDEDTEANQPAKRVIKPDFNLLLNNSFEESSDEEDASHNSSLTASPQSLPSPANGMMTPPSSSSALQRAVTRDSLLQDNKGQRPSRLQRRHTIMVCEAPTDSKVGSQELPPLEEEDEPSPVRESHLFSQFQQQQLQQTPPMGAALLHRHSFSEHDLSRQVVLRHPQGQGRKPTLEHRRSLTSLPSGLCAIPEMEDSPGGGADSPTKSAGSVRRSWSHEQAPPPNPSPPCKGRARATWCMGMTSMKPAGGSAHHPAPHRPHASAPSSCSSHLASNPSSNHGMAPGSVHPSSATSSHSSTVTQRAVQSSFKHASTVSRSPSSSSSTSPSPSSSAPASPTSLNPHANLDPAASSQSPSYTQSPNLSYRPVERSGASQASDVGGFERRMGRWRHPRAREERMNSRRKPRSSDSPPENETAEGLASERSRLTEEEVRSRRMSLESGVSVYTDTHDLNVIDDAEGRASRRLSMGVHNGKREGGSMKERVRRLKSPEEAERISRWRTLQEEELSARTRRVGWDMTSQMVSVPTADFPVSQVTQPLQQSGVCGSPVKGVVTAPPSEATDVLQQKLADEEIRFARWRQLEETGGLGHTYLSMADDPEHGIDRVSDRLQPVSPTHTSASAAYPSVQGTMPLPKRWQNPVECLSLTLEEVTHIRSVLTKAELESLISHPDLYQQVSKSKLCFTCKTTRFSLFGEWGTKCKFCKRTVCSKCLRKMNVPTDHFKNIPVYTLSPTPLTPEMQEMVQTFIKNAPPVSVPPTRNVSPSRPMPPQESAQQSTDQREQQQSSATSISFQAGERSDSPEAQASKGLFGRPKQQGGLHRSQSLLVPGQKQGPGGSRTLRGPVMAICCDCKGMVMEIIRASRASLTMLSSASPPAAGIAATNYPSFNTNSRH